MKLQINCDGSFNNTINMAKVVFVAKRDYVTFHKHVEMISAGNSESAELRSLIKGLEYLSSLDFLEECEEILLLNDNKNIVDGINKGEKTKSLLAMDFRYFNSLLESVRKKTEVTVGWIPRSMNEEADKLSRVKQSYNICPSSRRLSYSE